MNRIAAFLAALFTIGQLAVAGSPAVAQVAGERHAGFRTVAVESWVEEWDPVSRRWVKVAEDEAPSGWAQHPLPTITTTIMDGEVIARDRGDAREAARFAVPSAQRSQDEKLAQYGPFIVTGQTIAAMVGPTDSHSPHHFAAMLRDFPQVARLDMIEAPGTTNDLANLELGRMIRASGIATHVPSDGSVRSGAVELFLAGATRTLEKGAQFAVHSWLDNHGREADDFAEDHPAHRLYLDYYVEMGMSEERARAFYSMTNSVPHSGALWLRAEDMRPWIAPERETLHVASRMMEDRLIEADAMWDELAIRSDRAFIAAQPVLAYGDLDDVFLAQLDLSRLDSRMAFP